MNTADCSPEAWQAAHAASNNALYPDPLPIQEMEVVCAPPREKNWHETAYMLSLTLFLAMVMLLVFAARDRFYEKHGRDWRDDLW